MVISTLLNPSLLIADEVTSALDVSTQRAVGEMLIEFREREFVKEHDGHNPRPVDPGPGGRHDPRHVRRQARREGERRGRRQQPAPPYTQLLISSLPEVGVRHDEKTLVGIPGGPLRCSTPAGCRFKDRCPFAFDRCGEEPPFVEVKPGHFVACWLHADAALPAGGAARVLKLDNVTKVFKTGAFGGSSLPAVRRVSFEIRPGEVTALIGESGSGKSTLGKMILQLTPVTSGTITFEGTDLAGLRGKRLHEYYRHVQGVFQDPFSSYNPVFRADRVFATIKRAYFPDLQPRRMARSVATTLESVGLNPADVLDKFTHQLSGGQLQRILIARALLLDIKLLVADEIISMLDASTRVDVLNLLSNLKSRGLGVLFITHDLSLGNYIAERTIILRRGVIVEMGATEKVFDNPQHPYTKMLLTAVPQLHKKWEAGLAAELETTSGGLEDAGRPGRYSTDSLHPSRPRADPGTEVA